MPSLYEAHCWYHTWCTNAIGILTASAFREQEIREGLLIPWQIFYQYLQIFLGNTWIIGLGKICMAFSEYTNFNIFKTCNIK